VATSITHIASTLAAEGPVHGARCFRQKFAAHPCHWDSRHGSSA
jgi:hypothetical protein